MNAAVKSVRPSARPQVASRKAVVVRADGGFIGSTTNVIMLASIGGCLAASRFGLAPSVAKQVQAPGLKLSATNNKTIMSNDPAGFTVVDVMAMGSAGHAIGAGIVLGLKGIGAL